MQPTMFIEFNDLKIIISIIESTLGWYINIIFKYPLKKIAIQWVYHINLSPTQINNWLFAKYNIYKNMALLSKRYSRLLLKNLIGLISYINTLNIRIDPRGSIYLFRKICYGEFTYLQKYNKYVESNQRNWKALVWKAF